jgi:hypothetical protein
MKKHTPTKMKLLYAAAVIIAAINQGFSQGPMPVLTLSLCYNVVDVQTAETGVQNAYSWIKKQNNITIAPLEEVIPRTALETLNQSIISSHPGAGHNCIGFVPAIQVYLGLDQNRIKLFYKSVYLCTDNNGVNAPVSFTRSEVSGTTYSVYSGGFSSYAGAQSVIDTYTANIEFMESAGTRTFDPAYDANGDTRSVIIPLQEIFAMLEQNQNSSQLKIWNFANKNTSLPASAQIRQSLLLGPENMTPANFKKWLKNKGKKGLMVNEFQGKYADRSHLCPPSCNTMQMVVSNGTQQDCQH